MKQIEQHQHQHQLAHDHQQPTAAQQPAVAEGTPRKQQQQQQQQQRHHSNNGNSNRHFSADYEYAQQELRVATIAALSQQIKGKKDKPPIF